MWDAILSLTESETVDERWTFLGYDVADGGLLSCLSNFGYTLDSAPVLRAQWSLLLNEFHLFVEPDRAMEFKTLTDARVREHAPFFIFGLYLIEGNRTTFQP